MATPEIDLSTRRDESANERAIIQLWQTIGASKLANQIAATLSSQTIHAIERIRDEKLYLSAGYEKFDQFLDQHPESPMSHDIFCRRVKLLKGEGEVVFDLLNSLNVPFNQRKLLAGNMTVSGDEIEIEGQKARLDDPARIIDLISTLHGKTLEQQRTITRQEKKLKKGAADFEKLKRKALTANPDATESGQALITAAGALTRLRETLNEAPDEEKQALRDQVFEMLRQSQLNLSEIYVPGAKAKATAAGREDLGIDDEELDDLNQD